MNALIVVSVIAIAIVVWSIGKPLNSILDFKYNIDKTIDFSVKDSVDNKSKAPIINSIIDRQGFRVSLLNDKQEVTSSIDLTDNYSQSTIDVAQYSFSINNQIYVSGYEVDKDTVKVKSSKLIKYTDDGKCAGTICTYDNKENYYRYILNVVAIDDNTITVVSTDNENSIYTEDINITNNDYFVKESKTYKFDTNIVSCLFNKIDGSYIFLGFNGATYLLKNNNIQEIDINTYINNAITNSKYIIKLNFGISSNKCVEILDKNNPSNTIYKSIDYITKLNIDKNNLYISNYIDSCTETISLEDYQIDKYYQFNYSFPMLFYNYTVWACIIFSVVLFLYLFIAWLIWLCKKQNNRFFKIIIGLCILATVILATIFVSYQDYSFYNKEQQNKISSIANYISKVNQIETLNTKQLDKNIVGNDVAKQNIKTFTKDILDLENLISCFDNNAQPLSYCIYGYDPGDDKFTYIDSHTNSHIVSVYPGNLSEEIKNSIKSGKIYEGDGSDDYLHILFCIAPLYNHDKQLIGFVEIRNILNISDYHWENQFIQTMVILILMCIVLFLVLKEYQSISKSIKKYNKWKIKKIPHPEIHFMEINEFCKNFAVSVDSVLCVLISKNMLVQFGLDNNGVLIGLPVAAFGLGGLIGSLIFPILAKKLYMKQVYYISAFSMIFTMLIIAWMVLIGNYQLYIVSKLLFGISFGILYTADSTVPMCIDDEKVRFESIRSLALTDVSAPIIAVLACGILSEVFGSHSIYILGSVMGLCVLLVTIFFIPRKSKFSNVNKRKKVNLKIVVKFFRSPAIISCVLICLISFIVGAYKSYLFPLFANNLNISNVEISNCFTICSALVFIFSSSLDTFTKRFDHWNNVLWYTIVIALVFCLFNWNNTLIWAFTAFFISCLIGKGLAAEWRVLWPRKCKLENIDSADIQPIFSIFDNICITLRPIILGGFLFFGSAGACVALGITCFIGAAIFFVCTKNSPLRTNK